MELSISTGVEKILLIAVLRVLPDVSQADVAGLITVSNATVVHVEQWIETAPMPEIEFVFTNSAIRSLLVRELPGLEITEAQMAKARLVSKNDILRHYKREVPQRVPRLRFDPPVVIQWEDGTHVAKYATIAVINETKILAQNCRAWVDLPQRDLHLPLHFAGTEVTVGETDSPVIAIRSEIPARLDIAASPPRPGHETQTIMAGAGASGAVMVYGAGIQTPTWNGEGCWIAQPLALYNPNPRLKSYLAPGEYKIRISVDCSGGEGAVGEYVITSPLSWEGLKIRLA